MSLEEVIANNKSKYFSLTWTCQVSFTWNVVFEKLWSLVFYNREIVPMKTLYDIFITWWKKIPLDERLSKRGREIFYNTLVLFLDVGMSNEEFIRNVKKYALPDTLEEYELYFKILCMTMCMNEHWDNDLLLLNPQIVEEYKDKFKKSYLDGIAHYEHYQLQRENPLLPDILPLFDDGNWETLARTTIIEKKNKRKPIE